MRLVFLIPDLRRDLGQQLRKRLAATPLRRLLRPSPLRTSEVFGGTLNLMRHCRLAGSLGVEAVIATESGRNRYGRELGVGDLPTIRWRDRRPDDVCIVPDVYTFLIDQVEGPAVAYIQHPRQVHNDFDHRREGISIWTDSPPMLAHCQAAYLGKEVLTAPNIVDPTAFPFIPQDRRQRGELVAFPRKGNAFIGDVYDRYKKTGGAYWGLREVKGLAFPQFAARMHSPQAFLASADLEGCALPPQECMAAGIVVLGRNADGANFCMQHGETALVANTVGDAVEALHALEDPALRERLSRNGLAYIQRFFPDAKPTRFWREFLAKVR